MGVFLFARTGLDVRRQLFADDTCGQVVVVRRVRVARRNSSVRSQRQVRGHWSPGGKSGPQGLKLGSQGPKRGFNVCRFVNRSSLGEAVVECKLEMQVFMGGKLKTKGNVMLAQKLAGILKAATRK